MKKDEMKAYLAGCKSLVELVGKANQLKQAGEKESTVNRVVTEMRKEMLKTGGAINIIPREGIPDIDETPVGRIPFSINKLSAPSILYDGNTVLL